MKKILLLIISCYSMVAMGQILISPVTITLPANPPANTADWATVIQSLRILAQAKTTATGQLSPLVVESRILVTIKTSGGNKVCGIYNQQNAPSSGFNSASKTWAGAAALSLLGQDCVLQPGTYQLCVQFYGLNAAQAGLLGEGCSKTFTIVDTRQQTYSPPQNVQPADGKVFTKEEAKQPINFRWTPVLPKPKAKVKYTVRVWDIPIRANKNQVIKTQPPAIIKETEELTQLSIPASELKLGRRENSSYAWNVQASKQTQMGDVEMLGTSEATSFGVNEKTKDENNNPPVKNDIKPIIDKIKNDKNYIEVKDFTVDQVNTHSISESRQNNVNDCISLNYPALGVVLKNNEPLIFQYSFLDTKLKERYELQLYKTEGYKGKDSLRKEFKLIHKAIVSGVKYQFMPKEPLEPGDYIWQIKSTNNQSCNTASFSVANQILALTAGANCDSLKIDSIKCIGTINNPNLRRVFATIKNCSSFPLDFNNNSPLNNWSHWGFTSSNQLISSTTGVISAISVLPASIPAYSNINISFDYTPVSSSTNIWIYDWLSYLTGGGLRTGVTDNASDTLIACYCSSCDINWRCQPPNNGAFYNAASNSVIIYDRLCISDAIGAIKIKQISSEIVGFKFAPNDTNCMKCQNNNRLFGNYYDFPAPFTALGIGSLWPTTGFVISPFISPSPVPAHSPFYSRELIWQSTTSAGSPLNGYVEGNISLPAIIHNTCCNATCDIWIRYTITKADCTVCSVVYKYSFTI